MDEQDWIVLKVLYEKKNITKTAEHLYMSQPSLTKKIQQIEKQYQVEIVKRGTKGVHFTPQGEYLAQCAEEMLNRLQNIKDTVHNIGEEVSGTLRIGVSNYITRHKLPHLLKLFREQFPNVNYKVTTGWSKDVFHHVYHSNVQVGMVRGDYEWSGSKILLFEENLCITSIEKIQMDDLPALPRIEYETDGLLKSIIDNWWSGEFSQPPYIGMEVDKADTCKEMVLNGLGYGILPSLLVEEHPNLNQILIKDKEGNPIVRKTWLLYHEKSLENKVVKEFVEFMRQVDMNTAI